MPNEIEAKLRVDDLSAVRQKLVAAGARALGERFEVNQFFDRPDGSLLATDSGLRVRLHRREGQKDEAVVTFKGPQQAGPYKSRQETEVGVDSFEAAARLLDVLGFAPRLSFEKRRESFSLGACRVELDELPPPVGTFVEVEGPMIEDVRDALGQLGLTGESTTKTPYVAMVEEVLKKRQSNALTFDEKGSGEPRP